MSPQSCVHASTEMFPTSPGTLLYPTLLSAGRHPHIHRAGAFPPKAYSANRLHICPGPSLTPSLPLASPAEHCLEKGLPSPLHRPGMVRGDGTWHPHRTTSCQRAAVARPTASCGKARHLFQRRNKALLAAGSPVATGPTCLLCGRQMVVVQAPSQHRTAPTAQAPYAPLSCCHHLSD